MAFVWRNFVAMISFLSITTLCRSSKIFGFPFFGGSQYLIMKNMGLELAKRGHEFTILVSSLQKINPTEGITHIVYQVPHTPEQIETMLTNEINSGPFKTFVSTNNVTIPALTAVYCELLLNNYTQLLEQFKDFDLMIIDSTMDCGYVLADYLKIKKVEFCPWSPKMLSLALSPYESLFTASYVPSSMTYNPGKMDFFHRMKNTFVYFVMRVLIPNIFLKSMQDLKEKYSIQPEKSVSDSMKEHQLVLFLADFALEYPFPVPPYFKLVGPINIDTVRKPLSHDLQQLIDSSADDGFIIVSFGTNVASMSKDRVDVMAEAFGMLKQKVIWRLKGYIPSSLSPNIKHVSWMPQSDLLSHEKLRLFVSHAGQNSFYEAAYRGVPVVAIPLYSDQFDNTKLLEFRGFGLSLSFHELTADDLFNTIERVLKDPSYRKNAQRISRLMQDRPRSPVQEAGDWIEYALRHESLAHLRPYSSQLAWYQYFLVDVAVFLLLVVLVVIMLIKYTVRLMCLVCCRQDKKPKTQ